MGPESLARWESRLRPVLTRLPPRLAVRLYSRGRQGFLRSLGGLRPPTYQPPDELGVELWGIRFRSPILNAAGMFKNGEGYALAARQGAGAYLAGTTTGRPRKGKPHGRAGLALHALPAIRCGVQLARAAEPRAPGRRHAAPEPGPDRGLPRWGRAWPPAQTRSCPKSRRSRRLAAGLRHYEEARVDFLEMNESCPNTEAEDADMERLAERLRSVRDLFLDRRSRLLPVIVKFSCDTEVSQVPELVETLVGLGYDGVNFGNTSVAYPRRRSSHRFRGEGALRLLHPHVRRRGQRAAA